MEIEKKKKIEVEIRRIYIKILIVVYFELIV